MQNHLLCVTKGQEVFLDLCRTVTYANSANFILDGGGTSPSALYVVSGAMGKGGDFVVLGVRREFSTCTLNMATSVLDFKNPITKNESDGFYTKLGRCIDDTWNDLDPQHSLREGEHRQSAYRNMPHGRCSNPVNANRQCSSQNSQLNRAVKAGITSTS